MNQTSALSQLVYYVAYHNTLLRYIKQLFIVAFEDVTADPRPVFEQFSERYNLAFNLDFNPEETREQVFERIDSANTCAKGYLNDRTVHRPNPARAKWKPGLVAEMRRPENREWLEEAKALYAEFRRHAVGDSSLVAHS